MVVHGNSVEYQKKVRKVSFWPVFHNFFEKLKIGQAEKNDVVKQPCAKNLSEILCGFCLESPRKIHGHSVGLRENGIKKRRGKCLSANSVLLKVERFRWAEIQF